MRKNVTALKKFGFNTDLLRLQTNCHTKGIIVDGKVALIGSHNWTNAGTVFNRDASLIFHDQQIAAYFENLFLYDWNRIGRPRIDEGLPAVEIVTGLEGAPRAGMVRVAAEHWFGE
jgi:phosphatidylserine/phosphatidylglycerophosphate/cardiolipin synthase-like enzyme